MHVCFCVFMGHAAWVNYNEWMNELLALIDINSTKKNLPWKPSPLPARKQEHTYIHVYSLLFSNCQRKIKKKYFKTYFKKSHSYCLLCTATVKHHLHKLHDRPSASVEQVSVKHRCLKCIGSSNTHLYHSRPLFYIYETNIARRRDRKQTRLQLKPAADFNQRKKVCCSAKHQAQWCLHTTISVYQLRKQFHVFKQDLYQYNLKPQQEAQLSLGWGRSYWLSLTLKVIPYKVDDFHFSWKGVCHFLLVNNSNPQALSITVSEFSIEKCTFLLPPTLHSTSNLKMLPLK